MIIVDPPTAAAIALPTPIQRHLGRLRLHLQGAGDQLALEAQRIVFECLSEIAIAASVSDQVLDALFGARQACLAYLNDLEQGQTSTLKRRAALASVDLLEGALLNCWPATLTLAGRQDGRVVDCE